MKKLLAFMLATAMTATLAACGGTGDAPSSSAGSSAASSGAAPSSSAASSAPASSTAAGDNKLVINLGIEPKTIDPTLNSAVDGGWVINNTFEGLYRDKGNGFEPAIATEHTVSADSLTWTFKLRDAKWSDGTAVTAEDFVRGWQRAVDPATAAEYSYMFSPLANANEIMDGSKAVTELGVKAVDEKTLEVTLAQPCGYFLELTAFPTFMPMPKSEIDNDGIWAKTPEKVVSNGPFVLTEYAMNSQLVISKNAEYWDAANVSLEGVVCKFINDAGTALTAFNNGELDWNSTLPPAEIQNLIASGEADVYSTLGINYIVINQNTQIEALKDPRVRQAISMAIDRQQICDTVLRNGSGPAMGFVTNGLMDDQGRDFRDTAGNYYMDATAKLEEAKKLLADAGYPDGKDFPALEYRFNTADSNKVMAETLQAMLKTNLNITLNLVNEEWAVFQDTRNNAAYPALARHAWIGDYTDPQTFLDMYITVAGKPNVQSGNAYNNPTFDEALSKGMVAMGKDRFDNFYAAEKILIEDAYLIPLTFSNMNIMSKENISGWYVSATRQLWLGNATKG